MKKEDFTEEELDLLIAMFDGMENMIQTFNHSGSEFYINYNILYNLEKKLGIEEIVN